MWKKWTALALLAALLLAGCGGGGNQASPPPGDQLSAAEDSVNAQAAALLNDAIAAFSDVLPAGLAPQATGTEPPPLTLAYNGEETVLIGGPWRPPFPWPLPNGTDDLNGKPLFITIKRPSGPRPPKAHVGRLQRNARGEWEVAWYGERGAPPEVVPATVEQVGEFGDTTGPEVGITFSYKQQVAEIRKEISTFRITTCNTTGAASSCSRIHTRAPLPQSLPGREINSSADPGVQAFVNKLKDICCGNPKPFPPSWPPLILFRNDVSVVVVPYDNPRVREAQSLDDLIGQDIGFVYVRKKPFPDGTTTDCGPNGVWFPPREEPFYNVRVIREREAINMQFTKLGNPSQVVATLPAEVVVEPSDGREIGIMDSIDSPNEPVLKIKWPKIRIIVIIKIEKR
jgi:outer membrane murein-binding lipoprotein Lpp